METFVVDCNIFDLLRDDDVTSEHIRKLADAGTLKILVTRTVAEELYASPFRGIPGLCRLNTSEIQSVGAVY